MTYKVLDKIPRKHDFTKNRWPSADYEKYEDEQLNSKTVEINEDTKNLNKKYDEYCKFIKIIEPIAKKGESYYEDYSSFVKVNFKRTSTQEKIKEFIFSERDVTIHDNYFENHATEHSFFEKAKHVISHFTQIWDLYREFYTVNSMANYKYFFPKDSGDSKFGQTLGPFYPMWDFPFKIEYKDDIENFTELRRKGSMSHGSFDPKPCTHRTLEFYKKLHNLGTGQTVDVNGNISTTDKASVPYLPKESYARWYFNKIIDENNKLKRRIELILRSRQRSIELATNLNSIYVFSNKSYPKNTYKIGWTRGPAEDRAESMSAETGVLHPFKVVFKKRFKDAEKREKQIHKHFNEYRVRKNKEYFDLDLKKIINYIESIKETDIN